MKSRFKLYKKSKEVVERSISKLNKNFQVELDKKSISS